VARPWRKRSAWPYIAKSGKRSYRVGFYDHEQRERTKSFPSARHAREWMRDYITAERRGRDSLRRFLLDLDAKEANEAEGRTIAEIVELFLVTDAHPRNEEGLAPATYEQYASVLNSHLLGKPRRMRGSRRRVPAARYAIAIAQTPAEQFNRPQTPRAWREQMRQAGVPHSTRVRAWRALSSALSWASASSTVPEIETNGCRLAKEPVVSRRRSARRGGTGYEPAVPPRTLASWALSPQAVEAIRAQMLRGGKQGDALLARRDATIVSLQYGLATRNQELWGLRWSSIDASFAWVTEVISYGRLERWGKTALSTRRRTAMPSILHEDLEPWRQALRDAGHPARDSDFIIPGDLTRRGQGVLDPATGAVHLSKALGKKWGQTRFRSAVRAVAKHPEFAGILRATPYSLRRGGISLRLRTEDPQIVASECGTSLKMLSDHYSFPIEDLRHHEPQPADLEWRAARTALSEQQAGEREPRLGLFARLANGRKRGLRSAQTS
jgi:integrase